MENNIISSLSNSKIIKFSKLNQKKYRNMYKLFLVEGLNTIKESYSVLDCIITTDLEYSDSRVDILYVNDNVMYKIYEQKPIVKYIGVCRIVESEFSDSNVVILNKIKDPGNMGNIIRSAYSLGIENILLDYECVDIYNSKVIKAMHGVNFHLNIKSEDSYEFLLNNDYKIITSFLDEKHSYKETQEKYALVLGNESTGIEQKYKDLEHENFRINTKFESLNVSSAAAIILYELKGVNNNG